MEPHLGFGERGYRGESERPGAPGSGVGAPKNRSTHAWGSARPGNRLGGQKETDRPVAAAPRPGGHSTSRRPEGAIERSATGQVDDELGAVRREHVLAVEHGLAGRRCASCGGTAAPAIRRGSRAARRRPSTRRPPRSSASRRRAARRAARRTARAPRRRATAPCRVLGTPHRDARERMSVGEVAAADLEHAPHAEHLAHARGRGDEAEVEHAALRRDAGVGELRLDRAEPAERLPQRVGRDEPAEALPRVDEPFLVQRFERAAHGDAARGERSRRAAPRSGAAARPRSRPPRSGPAGRPRSPGSGRYALVLYLSTSGRGTRPTLTKEAADDIPFPARRPRLRAPARAGRGGPRGRRPAAHARREDPRRTTCATPAAFADARTRPQLRRLRSRPRRAAGRARADRRAAVHERGPDARRAADDRALRPPHPGARRQRTPTSRTRSTPTPRSTSSCAPRARSTASASGRPAPGSSTRSCSRTTRSPAA